MIDFTSSFIIGHALPSFSVCSVSSNLKSRPDKTFWSLPLFWSFVRLFLNRVLVNTHDSLPMEDTNEENLHDEDTNSTESISNSSIVNSGRRMLELFDDNALDEMEELLVVDIVLANKHARRSRFT
jgi:hypothetical protein